MRRNLGKILLPHNVGGEIVLLVFHSLLGSGMDRAWLSNFSSWTFCPRSSSLVVILLCFFSHSSSVSCRVCLTSSVALRREIFSCFCRWSIFFCSSLCLRAKVKFLQLLLSLISLFQESVPQLVRYLEHPLINEIFTDTPSRAPPEP